MHIQNILQTKTNDTGYMPDYGIHKGIVIDNKDPMKDGGRIQVYVPDIHSINLFGFLDQQGIANIPAIGRNVGNLTQDALVYLKTFCPWAVMCSPILSDAAPGGGESDFELTTPNQAEKFQGLKSQFAKPGDSLLARGNPFAYVTVPAYSRAPAGTYSIPRIGAQVMVLFYKGDLNSPVCLGSANGSLPFAQIFSLDGSSQNSPNGVSPPTNTQLPVTTTTTEAPSNKVTKSITTDPVAQSALPTVSSPIPPPPDAPNPLLPPLQSAPRVIKPGEL